MQTVREALASALTFHRAGRLREAVLVYQRILSHYPKHSEAHHGIGLVALQAGDLRRAVDSFSTAATLRPEEARFRHNLGIACINQGRLEEAETNFRLAQELDPTYIAHQHLSAVLDDLSRENGRLPPTAPTRSDSESPDLIFEQGCTLQKSGRFVEAVRCYERVVALDPNRFDAFCNLGSVLRSLRRFDDSVAAYQNAIRLNERYTGAYSNLGNVLRDLGRLQDAKANYLKALELDPNFAEGHKNLGALLIEIGDIDGAVQQFRKAIDLKPNLVEARSKLGDCLARQNRRDEAKECYLKAFSLAPDSPILHIKSMGTLPVIPESNGQIDEARRELDHAYDSLLQCSLQVEDPIREFGVFSFHLAYHGRNDRSLQMKAARLQMKMAPSLTYVADHCKKIQNRVTGDRRIRVGFVSRFFENHTIGKLNAGLVGELDRSRFETIAFLFAGKTDGWRQKIEAEAERVVSLPMELSIAREKIAAQELDVLFYPDIGMEPMTYYLGYARLAPVQCVTWGHPVTTGIPTMDYFVSSHLLEPAVAEEHYTEKLIRLHGLPTYYFKPNPRSNKKGRAQLGICEDANIYTCPQSLFKMHPDFDPLIGAILERDPKGRLLLIDGKCADWRRSLVDRFRKIFAESLDRVQFLPRLPENDFMDLLAASDVILDPVRFGGGNTTYQAFALGIPIVTFPGLYMRSRVTHACYQQMGVTDCVASTAEEYVEIAVRLGVDKQWRKIVQSKILSSNALLYENAEVVRELELFFEQAVRGGDLSDFANDV